MTEKTLAGLLATHANIYNAKIYQILQVYESLESLYEIYQKERKEIGEKLLGILDVCWAQENAHALEKKITDCGLVATSIHDDEYPTNLKHIPDPPYVLYAAGDISVLQHEHMLSCVGTRALSTYGKRAIGRIFQGLRSQPLVVVSGLALGVDAEVHRQAIAHELLTIAVLGGGLDRYEPTTKAQLGKQIEKHGCLISEYPPGVRPQKHHFLERNRIIAGLSKVTIVIEGKQHSGSLVTARNALQYGRDVGTVPGDIFLPNSEGPLYLLKDGAWPITSGEDILEIFGFKPQISDEDEDHPLLHVLSGATKTLDELVLALNSDVSAVQQQLTLLELDGRIAHNASGQYYII